MRDVAEKAFGFKRPGSIPRKPKGVLYKIHRIVRTEMQRMRTFAMQEGLEADQDIIGVHIQFGGGPCPGDVCPPKQGDYYKDGSDMGWPPPSIPFHPNCYDKETKVCTDSGWKLFSELKADDRIYSLNPETFNVGFLPYKQKVSYQYNGKMIHYTGCDVTGYFFDLMVTPDHMQLIKRKRQGAWWELVPDRELSENVNFMFMGEHMATEAIDLRRAEIDYNDYVYDVELPKWHVLLVKRNGVPVWSGNCTCYDWYLYPKLS